MLAWLFPTRCVACGAEGPRWCAACAPGPIHRPAPRAEGIEAVFAVARYGSPAGDALQRAKLDGDGTTARALAALFAARVAPLFPTGAIDAVVPAPSTRRSRGRRGFATGELFAHAAARALGVPLRRALRSTATSRLRTLSADERRSALRGRVLASQAVDGTVLLVDDVLTTGATSEACALELLGGTTDCVLLAVFAAVDDRPTARPVAAARGAKSTQAL